MASEQRRMKSISELSALLPERGEDAVDSIHSGSKSTEHDGKGQRLHMRIEKQGRKGKIVTVIFGFHHNPQTLEAIAKLLKQHCGAGGTVRGLEIEIQGEQREKVATKLRTLNYLLK